MGRQQPPLLRSVGQAELRSLSKPGPSIAPQHLFRHVRGRGGCPSLRGQVASSVSLDHTQRRVQRALEIAPGALTWTILIVPVVASLIFAPYIAYAIFAIDVYWFLRTAIVVVGIRSTFGRMRAALRTDWWERCEALADQQTGALNPRTIVHAVLIPTYTEPYAILRETVRAIADSDYPTENKVVAIITRETDRAGWENVRRLQDEFGSRLRAFFHIKDPLLPGIVVGKSAAMAYGGPVLRRELEALGLTAQQVIITDLDSDFRVHRQYFAYVTYHYVSDPRRLECIFQPIPMFHNNLWRVPSRCGSWRARAPNGRCSCRRALTAWWPSAAIRCHWTSSSRPTTGTTTSSRKTRASSGNRSLPPMAA